MKCDKCGYVSFDHNYQCPSCDKDLSMLRKRLGMYLEPPDGDWANFFAQDSSTTGFFHSATTTQQPPEEDEAELDLDTSVEDFEFTLDDD